MNSEQFVKWTAINHQQVIVMEFFTFPPSIYDIHNVHMMLMFPYDLSKQSIDILDLT